MTTIRPIETVYSGWRFRSRLEARWAVYFDAIGIKWEYELQGYDLDGVWYLPDFWLPQVRSWAEAKPEPLTPVERDKVMRLVHASVKPCVLLVGTPDFRAYEVIEPSFQCTMLDGQLEVFEDPPCTGTWTSDAILSNRYLHENRFYANTGTDDPVEAANGWEGLLRDAVHASRSARFEARRS